MRNYDNDGGSARRTQYDAALDNHSANPEHDTTPGYGTGLRIDLKSYLEESETGRQLISTLDPLEKFVVIGYYILMKPQKMLAQELSVSEFRLNQFLDNVVHKIGSLVVLGRMSDGEKESILKEAGAGYLTVREAGPGRALDSTIVVSTMTIVGLFREFNSFPVVGERLGAHYVDIRRELEKSGEKVGSIRGLGAAALSSYIQSIVKFASLRGSGYSGRLGQLPCRTESKDPAILSSDSYDILSADIDSVLYPRAVFAF